MAEYLVAFNDDWVPDLTLEELQARSRVLRPLIAEMRAAGVLIFTGGLAPDAPVFSVVPHEHEVVVSDGPYIETKEHIGGFAVIDVNDDDAARHWASRIALACGWPQEVRPFMRPMQLPEEA